MKTDGAPTKLHREMAELLRQARRRVFWSAVCARVPAAAYRATQGVTGVAGVWLVWRLAARLRGQALPGWTGLAISAGIIAAVAAMIVLARALRRAPSLQEAAQRLDLAVCDHNRIAIALALVEAGDGAEFARAAIDDGLTHLRRLKEARPAVTAGRWKLHQIGYLAALGGLFVLLSTSIHSAPAPAAPPAEIARPSEPLTADRDPNAPARPEAEPPARPPQPPRPLTVASAKRDDRHAPTRHDANESSRGERASGKTGGGTGGRTAQPGRPTDAFSDAGQSTAEPKELERKESKPGKPKKGRETPSSPSKDAKADEENSSIMPGAAGGGAMSAAQSESSQKIQNADGDRDDEDTDKETEDAEESSTQRGGIQPMLKDRQAAPSRDLGISGDDGQPGNGRGGPSPQKKSRGTASLVLGVPIPDFIRGRLGPGMTKISHERMDPPALPGEPARETPAMPRSLPESECPRFDVPADVASIVKSYLVALHSADERKPTASAPAADRP